ncbi:hypothetical protein KY321_01745, partial [Candidatus Woesearchaeota archaeon]|nr:hypothetical protein [Candidatus Woesearchaeota archaeon]
KMAKKQKRKTTAVKKKKWVSIVGPNGKELGESYVEESNSLVGRKLKVNLMTYSGNPKQRRYNVSFVVSGFDGDVAKTTMSGFETQPTSIKMSIKKGSDRIDHRVKVATSNKQDMILKPIIITKGNTSALVRTEIRKAFDVLVKDVFSKKSTSQALDDVIFQKVQKDLKRELSKVHPVRMIVVKKFFIEALGDDESEDLVVEEELTEDDSEAEVTEEETEAESEEDKE